MNPLDSEQVGIALAHEGIEPDDDTVKRITVDLNLRAIDHCSFWTVPNDTVRGRGRFVKCNRRQVEHPVQGEGYYVDHARFLAADND